MSKARRRGCTFSLLAVSAVAVIGIAIARRPAPPPIPSPAPAVTAAPGSPNILLLTVDDMNWDSSGVYGNPIPGITPNIDRLAAEGVLFQQAFVTSPICQPSRSAWMTGRYPHASGAIGFLPINPGVPTLPETLRGAGWRIGILAKNTHTPPLEPTAWDYWITPRDLGVGRDPEAFYRHTRRFIEDSKKAGKPFFLNANIQDPHRPFPGGKRAWWGNILNFLDPQGDLPPDPPQFVKPQNVHVPGYLPDLPEVREELSQYYTAVHRADQSVGRIMQALRETGADRNTLIVFASDNGMAFPFAKQTLYDAGLRSQLIVRWPGHAKAGHVVSDMATGTDVMPTILHAAGIQAPAGMNGKSFLTALSGSTPASQGAREIVGYVDRVDIALPVVPRKVLAYPSRSITTGDTIYIWNQWSGEDKDFISESQTGLTYPAMKRSAEANRAAADRLRLYLRRPAEELYDRRADPNALNNRVRDQAMQSRLKTLRYALLAQMIQSRDPQLPAYQAYLRAN